MTTAGFWRDLVEILSIIPRPRARRRQYPGSWRADEHSDGGSGELSGDDLVKFYGLVLPRSRGFRDKHRLGRSWATSSEMATFVTLVDIRSLRTRLLLHGDEVSQSPSSPVEGSPEENPLIAIHPSIEEKTNIMTIEELNALRETYFFPPEVRARLPDEGRPSPLPAGARWLFTRPRSPLAVARNKKVLLGGYPATSRGRRASSSSSPAMNGRFPQEHKHCNNLPRLFGDEMKVFDEAFQSVEKSGRFSVPVLLESKSFGRVFGSPESRTSRTAGAHLPSGEAPSSSSDVGESKNPHDQARRESPSRDDSIECLGSIRTNFRRLLPHIPDLTLLRWVGGKGSGSYTRSFLECSELEFLVGILFGLEPTPMSKRVSFKKIGEKLGKAVGASSGTPTPAKGVVIGGKRAGESITSSPSKKAKAGDGSKGKKGPRLISALFRAPRLLSWVAPSVAERLLRGVIPPADKEKVDKLTLDQTATKLFHVIGQALVLGSSLAVRSREAGEQASLQEGRVASMESEVARLQKLAADFEQQLAESRAREQQANNELAKAKSDRDLLSDQCGRSGVLVNELREALNKSKDSAVEEFKSSSKFMVAVEDAASKYFGEGF
ncbi:hypothetical protein Acr_11g0001490 [Actinidia rufa]|uniref:Uncharacterized protein n=1 Tax=Actinidia rufa TaxID=165716 RepID=A0A7J0FB61_9ERIC|nr:hypothetical protein Acr_11g0001490 [Actinidia rufa]